MHLINDERLTQLTRRIKDREVGGLLVGHWEDHEVYIEDIIQVTDPNATYNSWSRDETRAQKALNEYMGQDVTEEQGYVGDWHTHPEAIGASRQDLTSLKRASKQYREPIVLVVCLPYGILDIHVAVRGKLKKVEVVR